MPTSYPRHSLLRGGRWRLARPQSRALWTPATPRELADLFDDPRLRARAEDFLRLVARTVDGVETLLIFDHDARDLAVALTLAPGPDARCAWDWIGTSLADRQPSPLSFVTRGTSGSSASSDWR